jgi:hypothetical protein
MKAAKSLSAIVPLPSMAILYRQQFISSNSNLDSYLLYVCCLDELVTYCACS